MKKITSLFEKKNFNVLKRIQSCKAEARNEFNVTLRTVSGYPGPSYKPKPRKTEEQY